MLKCIFVQPLILYCENLYPLAGLGGYGEREETMVSNLKQKVERRKTKGNGTRKVDFSLYPLLFFEGLNWLL